MTSLNKNKLQILEDKVKGLEAITNEFLTEQEIMTRVSALVSNFTGNFRIKSGDVSDLQGKWKLTGEGIFLNGNNLSNLGDLAWENEVQDIINARIDTQSAQILANWTFGSSGAIKIAQDSNNGLWISPTGILAKSGGDTTLTITNSGDATFSGDIVGSSISGGTITGGTITGTKIRTAISGTRVEMNTALYSGGSDASLVFYSGNTLMGGITAQDADSFGVLTIGGADRHIFIDLGFNAANNKMEFRSHGAGGVYGTRLSISGDGDLDMDGNLSITTGSGITLGGTKRTTWPSAGTDTLSGITIDTSKNWLGYNITGLGDITPYSNVSYDLGSSSRYWDMAYLRRIEFYSYSSTPSGLDYGQMWHHYGVEKQFRGTPYASGSGDIMAFTMEWLD